MYVTKVVDLCAKIPEQLSLHFSVFSTICKRIYNFAVFQNKRKRKWKLASRPVEQFGGSHITPWPELGQGRRRRLIPGEEEARRRRGWRPRVRAHRALPVGGCCGRRGWPEQVGGCSGRRRSGGLGGGRGVGKLHGGEEKLARGLI